METTPDPEISALREKYRIERDKRLRLDANDQYVEVVGDFAAYVDDPYLVEELVREPLTDEVEVAVIGGGFGGLLTGARLREAGVHEAADIRIIEKGGDFGGTWYWNRYPGAMCDVESYVYLPLLEELGVIPTEKYVKAREILAHCQAIGQHYQLYDNACFQTEVTELRWDDTRSRWIISTNRGDAMVARHVVMANGPLHRPKLPGIEGVGDFTGHTFHTSRWDYDYTGGGPDGGLDRLAGKRIAVIGTGATAVQCVPHLGAGAEQLYVLQRTPSSVDRRDNRPTDPEWAASLEPGWHQERMENFNNLVTGIPQEVDLVDDGWTDIIGKMMALFREGAATGDGGIEAMLELADMQKMNEIRARAEEIVADPGVAESLKPYYRQFCKRPCFHDEYLQTFNLPNVTLIDTDGRGVDRITATGVVANGAEYEVDCIIFATGFEVGTGYSRRAGYEIVGRDGQTLTAKWEDGVATLHGMHSNGFPNCYIFSHMQGGFTVNYPHMLDELARHVSHILADAAERGATVVEATSAGEADWVQTIIDSARDRQQFLESCTPGYYNNEGRPGDNVPENTSYGLGSVAFFGLLEQWRNEGSSVGLEFSAPVSDSSGGPT